MRSSRAPLLILAFSLFSFGSPAWATPVGPVTELLGPGDFTGPSTVIDFDEAADGAAANTLYSGQGVGFSNCDPLPCTSAPVPIRNETLLDPPGVTTSPPNTITTQDGINGSEFSVFLDLLFTSPTFEVGAFFGNDQGLQPAMQMQLSVFDVAGAQIGYVLVDANENTDIDQFAGLRSATPFYRARFENIGTVGALSVSLDDVQFSTPVPEPSSLALLGCGLGLLARWRRRK